MTYCLIPCRFSRFQLCDPYGLYLTRSSVHGDSPSKNTEVCCHALLQSIVLTQGSNPGLLHYRWILFHLSHYINLPIYI